MEGSTVQVLWFRVGRVTMAIGSPAGFLARVAAASVCGRHSLWCDVSVV